MRSPTPASLRPARRAVLALLVAAVAAALPPGCDAGGGGPGGPAAALTPRPGRPSAAPPPDAYADLCHRADACNALLGYTVGECADAFRECTDALFLSERLDWEHEVLTCLEAPTCGDFLACFEAVPWC